MSKKSKLSLGRVIRNDLWMLKKISKYTPQYIFWMIAEGVIWGIHHSVSVIFTQQLFNALGRNAGFEPTAKIILYFAVYVLLFWIFHNWYWSVYNPKIRQRMHIELHSELFSHAVNIDIAKYDDPVFYNDFVWSMEKAYNHANDLMVDVGKLINRLVASVTLTGILFSVDATMAIIIFALSIFRMVLSVFRNKTRLKYVEALNPLDRKDEYIKRVFKLPDYAKELRITKVSDNLTEELEINTTQKKKVIKKYGKLFALFNILEYGLSIIGESGLIILMLYKVMITKEVELGGFAVAVNACWKMSWLLRDLVGRSMKIHEHGIFIEKMIHFINCKPTIVGGKEKANTFESLEIRNLDFSYLEAQPKNVLENVSLKINKGEKIAIVGYNGAGKTTLTKLIMRLYDPVNGDILYNGKDLKEYDIDSLRQKISAVFQDYRIFASSLAENVAGGGYVKEDRQRILDALKKSDFTSKLETLDNGIDTTLTREFDKTGTELSGGEKQKVAIARAFYKDAELIILDEPSSALDPDAEYELNRSIAEYSGDKTVIFISHRLSTTRHADRIYMFDSGRLIESGSHEELIKLNGKYAYMFNLQAEKYR